MKRKAPSSRRTTSVERGVLRSFLGATDVERGVLRSSRGATNVERGVLRSSLGATNVERGVLLSPREPGPFQKTEHLRKSASVSGACRAVDWAVPSVLPFHLPHSLVVLGCKANRLVFHARLPHKTKRANLRAQAQYSVLGALRLPGASNLIKPLARSMAPRASTACPARAC